MSPSIRYVLQLADPRGRYDRADFLWAAINLLAGQVAFVLGLWVTNASFMGWRGLVANAVFVWLGYAAISKRLHDLGRSALWLLGATLGWLIAAGAMATAIVIVAGPSAIEPGAPGYLATFALMMLPPLVLAAWLHLAEGESVENRYGPATAPSFSSNAQHA